MSDTFDLIDWINRGTVGERDVVIYNDPSLVAEYERLEARHAELLRDADDDPEATLADEHPAAAIEREMVELYERFEASKMTWTIRALTDAEVRAIHERLPLPDGPREPREPKGSPKASQAWAEYRRALAAYKADLERHLERVAEVQDDRNLHTIAAATMRVTTTAGTVDGVTYEQVRALREGPYGKVRVERLINAISDLTTKEAVIPAPKSRAPQPSTQD